MRVVILTEARQGWGYGHLTRCLSIRQAMEERGVSPEVFVNADVAAHDVVERMGFTPSSWLSEESTLHRLVEASDIVVVDSYHASHEQLRFLQGVCKRLVCFDDYMRLEYPPCILVNGSVNAENLPYRRQKHTIYLLGVKYTPLRKEFWDIPRQTPRDRVTDVLIAFGWEDSAGLAKSVAGYMKRHFPVYTYHVVSRIPIPVEGIRVYHDLTAREMVDLIKSADIAISAAGQSIYELARMGVPTVMVGIADNQRYNIQGWKGVSVLREELWWQGEESLRHIGKAFASMLTHDVRLSIVQASQICDGQGARRVAQEVLR